MERVIPPNQGQAFQYTWDDEGNVQNIEPLERIQEESEPPSTQSGIYTASKPPTISWPFHRRRASDARSSTLSSHLRRGTHSRRPSEGAASTLSSHMRLANWKPRSFSTLLQTDDSMSISRSIVPDYVVHFMRGETPETLQRKREMRHWGEHNAEFVERRTMASTPVEYPDPFASSTDRLHYDASQQSGLRYHFTGWRGGVVCNTLVSFLILVVGIVLLIIAFTKTRPVAGQSAIYTASCNSVRQLDIGLHAIINLFVIVLLSGANYVFQVLTSPTRREVTAAHAHKWWLDIGIPSLRNFLYISNFRRILAAVLMLCAVAITVIYNAIIFTTPSRDDPETCSLALSNTLLGVSALLNLVIVVAMGAILVRATFNPLITVGDAIRSFLDSPDAATMEAGLLTKADVKRNRWGGSGPQEPKEYKSRTHFWLQAPSIKRWVFTLLSWALIVGPAAAALAFSMQRMMMASTSSSLFPTFGTAVPASTFPLSSSSYAALGFGPQPAEKERAFEFSTTETALIAALPHLLLAILYLFSNSLLTTFFVSYEFSLFAACPRFLRVSSNPRGAQCTSLFLSLPRPVSWALLLLFVGAGLCLSQAVVPVFSTAPRPNVPTPAAIGFNTTALVPLLGILLVLLLGTLTLGLRRAPAPSTLAADQRASQLDLEAGLRQQEKRDAPGKSGGKDKNPLVLTGGPCTPVIAAKCHPSAAEPDEFWIHGPVSWGVVADACGPDHPGRCAFSAMPALRGLREGDFYV